MQGRNVSCVVLLLLAVATAVPASATPADGIATRDALVRFATALDETVRDPELSAALKRGREQTRALSPEDANRIFAGTRQQATALDSATRTLKSSLASSAKDIAFPEPDVEPSNCANMTPSIALGLLIAKASAEDVIAAVKWVCHETALGENDALACVGPELIANTAKAAFESAEFCLGEKRSAGSTVTREIIVNIGKHLNENVDAKTSSRATQTSVDNLQTSTDTANDKLDGIQSDLDDQFPALSAQQQAALTNLDALTTTLNGVMAQVQDLQFRERTGQIDIEDIQSRSADLQQRASEIRSNVLALQASLTQLADRQTSFETHVDDVLGQATRDHIAEVLGNPDAAVIRYQLPASAGGELEEVREVVVQAIQAVQSTGGDTGTASSLLSQGNQAFNQGNYGAAYDFFAQAYRALTGSGTP